MDGRGHGGNMMRDIVLLIWVSENASAADGTMETEKPGLASAHSAGLRR